MNYDQLPSEYLDDLLVSLAHHSSGIEGNTITLPETVTIILFRRLPKGSGATIKEFYEIENHKHAFEYMLEQLENDSPLTTGLIKKLHYYLTDRLQYDSGKYKTNPNTILGANFETASPHHTPSLMDQLVDNLNYKLKNSDTENDKLEAITDSHIKFERIHPLCVSSCCRKSLESLFPFIVFRCLLREMGSASLSPSVNSLKITL
ncbi:Fic family protein, partial [Marinilactibacillus psychrotolerans]|uniref:Fic family protein n=1 Tax=Marinilactibacillus psychrotolerans TaxID=191770 RepID=UPI003887ECB5